jgi:hypothetical protein
VYRISNATDLNEAIHLLEDELNQQKQLITDQVNVIYENFKPVNVIKDVFREVVSSDEFRSNVLTAAIAISTGYVTKKLVVGKNRNLLKALGGNLLQYGIANLILHPSRILKSVILPILGMRDFKSKKKQADTQHTAL